MVNDYVLRQACKSDSSTINQFINLEPYIHRHLDWRSSTDWLDYQPYWLLLRKNRVVAVLACPADPQNVAWIRLFGATSGIRLYETWSILFEKARNELPHNTILASVALRSWFSNLLEKSGFRHHQDIVVLEWRHSGAETMIHSGDVNIRPLYSSDLPAVARVDQQAFSSLWQLSLEGLYHAYRQSAYSTVVEQGHEVIAYQISSSQFESAHLARLAVIPSLQKQHIGQSLVYDMLDHFSCLGIERVTVNTQKDNEASIALYQKLEFHPIPETFPVYIQKV